MTSADKSARFWDAYAVSLAASMAVGVDAVAAAVSSRDRVEAMGISSVAINTPAFADACHAVGIEQTHSAIANYLGEHDL